MVQGYALQLFIYLVGVLLTTGGGGVRWTEGMGEAPAATLYSSRLVPGAGLLVV